MSAPKLLILYTTAGCHLCEQAKALAQPLLDRLGYCLKEIDIAESAELMDRYGVRIPVVVAEHSEQELSWPFTDNELENYLRALTYRH